MKKFSKILTLLLALVVIVTAFTVITLAAEKPEAKSFSGRNNNANVDPTFQTYQAGALHSYRTARAGLIFYDATADGNKYMSLEYVPGSSSTALSTWFYSTQTAADFSTYSVANYPVMSFDFDIMSKLGSLPTNAGANATYFTFWASAAGHTGADFNNGFAFDKIELANLGLKDKAAYEWRHLTFVFEFVNKDIDGEHCDFKISFYENGKKLDYEMKIDFTGKPNANNRATWADYEAGTGTWLVSGFTLFCERFGGAGIEAHLGFDNFSFNYFPKGEDGNCAYDTDEVGSYVYNDSYQLPATSAPAAAVRTDASGIEYFYATVKEAFVAAENGDTITLFADADANDLVIVDKAVTVKTALVTSVDVGETLAGTAVSTKTFKFEYVTKDGYLATAATVPTTLVFAQSEDVYTVNWDPACEGECGCEVAHNPVTTTVALGQAPVYTKKYITFEPDAGKVITFLGWSNTKGGAVVDLSTVTSNTPGGTVALYPVYDVVEYNFSITDSKGGISYHPASNFASAIANAEAGSTVTLLEDITISESVLVNSSVKIDLNGHKLIYDYYYGTGCKNAAASPYLFNINAAGVKFELVSSVGGGEVYASNTSATEVYDGEVLTSRTLGNKTTATVIYCAVSSSEISVDGGVNRINFFAPALLYLGGGNNKVDVKNFNFYHMKEYVSGNHYGTGIFTISLDATSNNTTNFSDGFFYLANYSMLFYTTGSTTVASYTYFNNCDMVKAKESEYAMYFENKSHRSYHLVYMGDCRAVDFTASGDSRIFLNPGFYNSQNYFDPSRVTPLTDAASSVKQRETALNYTYLVPSATAYTTTVTDGIQSISFDLPATTPLTCGYSYVVTKAMTVNWKNGDTTEKTQTDFYPGYSSYEAPNLEEVIEELEGDLYRGLKHTYQWADATGVPYAEAQIDWTASEITFYVSEATEIVPYLSDAQLSLSYVTQFYLNFYLPVVEGMERPTITGAAPSEVNDPVMIDGKEYYLYVYWIDTVSVFNTKVLNVNYTIDGIAYTARVDISGLIYADMILSNQTYYAAEAESVANMVRYAYQAYVLKATSGDSTVAANLATYSEKITKLIGTVNADGSTAGGKYPLSAYTTSFGEDAESDIGIYTEYIHSVTFGLRGGAVRMMVYLTEGATKDGVRLVIRNESAREETGTIKGENGEDVSVKYYFTDNQRVYNAIGKISIDIYVPGQENPITTTYSLAHYITEMKDSGEDITLAKAIYDFGVAAKTYRENRTDY